MIISVFSPLWFALLGACIAVLAVVSLIMRGKSREKRLRFIKRFSVGLMIWFVIYKAWIILAPGPGFETTFFEELPLALCNLAMFFAYFGAKKDIRPLQALLYFCCTLGALMALLMPSENFYDVSVLMPRCIGYWGFHYGVLFLCLSFVTMGVYRPRMKDVPVALLLLLLTITFCHGCNLLLRGTVCPEANYGYTFGIEGNPIMEFLLKLIPYPLLFEFPLLIPVAPVCCLMCKLANLGKKKAAV